MNYSVNWKCPDCGGEGIVQIGQGAWVKGVLEIDENGEPTLIGDVEAIGATVHYQCDNCSRIVALTSKILRTTLDDLAMLDCNTIVTEEPPA